MRLPNKPQIQSPPFHLLPKTQIYFQVQQFAVIFKTYLSLYNKKTIDSVFGTHSVSFQNRNRIATTAPLSPKLYIGAYTTPLPAGSLTATSNSTTTVTGLPAAANHLSGNQTHLTDPGNTHKQAYFAHILPQA